MLSASEILATDGPLGEMLEGFCERDMQQEMADVIADVIDRGARLVCEAGTGTGKTFAYLVPALRYGGKVIISTGTKNLQDQLFDRDLPMVHAALGAGTDIALLKGRANYLCRQRLELALHDPRHHRRDTQDSLLRIQAWGALSDSGDIGECSVIPEHSRLWQQVTSTTDNCLGQECPSYDDCFVVRARRRAIEADVLVVNHHLFFADMALRESGFGEILPGADAYIFDEAHQLPEVAAQFLGVNLSNRQLLELARDAADAQLLEAPDMPELGVAAGRVEQAADGLAAALGGAGQRRAWAEVAGEGRVREAVAEMAAVLTALGGMLKAQSERGKALAACARRCADAGERLDMLAGAGEEGYLQWFETRARGFSMHLTPIEVADTFRRQLEAWQGAWVFTSATLAVAGDFDHFTSRMGLDDAERECWASPFDYAHQALMYLPRGLPQPNTDGYTKSVVECALPVIEASRGRAFFLFTSHRALAEAAGLLSGLIDYPLLVQGQASRSALLEQFRELKNAVLLGTASFWEGVDVRGEALSCVIIDKLPFASPADPVMQARLAALRERGEEPFMSFQLPQAVVALKQGAGRLIRDTTDHGVLMLCDPRLHNRGYGRVFLDSLPPMPRTSDPADVEQFFAGLQQS